MKGIRSFFYSVSRIGVSEKDAHIHQKEIILSNKISLILMPLAFFGLWLSYFRGVYFTSIGFGILILFLSSIFLLNKFQLSLVSRILLSVLPQLFLLLPNIMGGVGRVENHLAFSYIFIAFTFIPLLLFQNKKGFGILILTLMGNFLLILFYDVLLVWNSSYTMDLHLIDNNYLYFKIPQLILWLLVVSVMQYVKHESLQSEKKYLITFHDLTERNEEINLQKEKISLQNDSLNEFKNKAEEQTSKLQSSNNELKNTKIELLHTIEKLKDAKEKLLQKEEEAKSIFNALNEHYLVAQYDLEGNLVGINTKVKELLGVIKSEQFQHIKPKINTSKGNDNVGHNGEKFNQVWKSIISGQAQTIELEYEVGDSTKSLATTFAPLFDVNKKPYKILAIGHDVSELIDKNEKIDKINDELKEKIHEISQQNVLLSFQQSEIFDKSEELHRQKEEIQTINESLEERVKERTKVLEEKNKQLTEYAFINSHVLRSPVSTMMGLLNLMKYTDLPDEERKVYEHLKDTAKILDNIVFKINNALDNGFHFDRDYIEPERNFQPLKKS